MRRYLLDSNIYINFYDRFYRIKHFPTFWEILPTILNNCVVIPKIVTAENYQDPWFNSWLDTNCDGIVLNHKDYAQQWGEILQYISDSPLYKPEALSSDKGWAHVRIADPWIVAIAKAENLTLVTNENRNPNLNGLNPSKAAKIPDICDDLGIRCIDMNTFFEEISLQI